MFRSLVENPWRGQPDVGADSYPNLLDHRPSVMFHHYERVPIDMMNGLRFKEQRCGKSSHCYGVTVPNLSHT